MSDNGWDEMMEQEKRKSHADKVVSLFPTPKDDTLPGEHSDYRAASLPANSGLTRLVVILGAKEFRVGRSPYHFFQYVHLGAESTIGFTEDGQVMTFHFTGMHPKIVTVRGRNLLQICNYIQLHRLHWIRQADRDFTSDEAVDDNNNPLPFIKEIEINLSI